MKYYILLLICYVSCFSQDHNIATDTLQLNELVVSKGGKKQKIKKLKLEGVCSYPEDMRDALEIVTLADGLPKGTIASVTFYFNKLDAETYKSIAHQFAARDLEVVLYDANSDGTPGLPSAIERQSVVVDKANNGKITVDLSFLNIDTQKKMYIGLRKTVNDTASKGLYLDCLCNGQDKYITYTRGDAAPNWERRWPCAALKLEVHVEVK